MSNLGKQHHMLRPTSLTQNSFNICSVLPVIHIQNQEMQTYLHIHTCEMKIFWYCMSSGICNKIACHFLSALTVFLHPSFIHGCHSPQSSCPIWDSWNQQPRSSWSPICSSTSSILYSISDRYRIFKAQIVPTQGCSLNRSLLVLLPPCGECAVSTLMCVCGWREQRPRVIAWW